MVRILGVVLAASSVRAKVTHVSIQVFCLFLLPMFHILLSTSFLLIFASYFLLPGVSPSAVLAVPPSTIFTEGYMLPRKCNTEQVGD